jgi:general secretion pathway protein H
MSRAGNSRGFSLLELIVVMVVIALAVAVSYPTISRGAASIQLKAAGRDVLNSLRVARERAISEQAPMRMLIDKNAQTVVLSDDFGDGARSYALPRDIRIAHLRQWGEELLDAPLMLRFLPNGSAEDGEIVLQSKTGATLTIATDPITGGARIVTPEAEAGAR